MSTLKRASAPDDLRETHPEGPRPRSVAWQVGDVVTFGRERWAVRVLTGDAVELEALNAASGIWWRTTLDRLPVKAAS